MKPPLASLALVGLCLLHAVSGEAQSLYGQADWVLYRATTDFGGTKGFTKLFTQSYTVGYESVLWDPRLGNYLADVTFLRSDMRSQEIDSNSSNFGFSLGANLFPNRPFPFSITATRSTGATTPQFPGFDFVSGAAGVPLPPGYVPERYDTKLSSLDLNWQLMLPSWPQFNLNYRSDSGSTAAGPYEGTEKNRSLTTALQKEWAHVRNQLNYTAYSGESRVSFPIDRSQKELLYNLTADLSEKLRATARAGYRDITSTFAFSTAPEAPPGAPVPPVLSSDLTSYYSSGGLTYQASERLGLDALVGFERLGFDRNGTDASSDALYTIGTARYTLFDGLNVTGSGDSSRRSETIGSTTRQGTQRGIGGGVTYAPTIGIFRPIVGVARGVGHTETLDGRSGGTGSWSKRAGVSMSLGPLVAAGADYEDIEATDDIFSLGNYTRKRWQVNAQSRPVERLRLDGMWERTNLDQGLGSDRLRSDYRLGQAGAIWQLDRAQSLGARFGSWRTESGVNVVHTTYGVGSYRAYFRALRLQAEFVRDTVRTERPGLVAPPDRIVYRVQGYVEYRLRLFTFGFDYRYSNNAEVGVARYLNREWRIRISRRFGAGFRR